MWTLSYSSALEIMEKQKRKPRINLDPPTKLLFKAQVFLNDVTTQLKISNPTVRAVGFKVKTTAPNRYTVRPNKGVLKPNASIVVYVTFQPLEISQKFLVQSSFVTGVETDASKALADAPKNRKMMDHKFSCIFELPGQSNTENRLHDFMPSEGHTDDRLHKTQAEASLDGEEANVSEEHARHDKEELCFNPAREVTFTGPFTRDIYRDLKISNPTNKRVCFVIKAKDPKRYAFRPNKGFIEPKDSKVVVVKLKPLTYNSNGACDKHKFMVQSIYVPRNTINSDELWLVATRETIAENKLACDFESCDGGLDVSNRRIIDGTSLSQDVPLDSSKQRRHPDLCKVCMDSEIRVVHMPCKHFVCCQKCAGQMTTCPICRQDIIENINVFKS